MNHFYQNIQGWFSFEKFYNELKFFDNMHIVEVGCWKGKSSSCMAVNIINSNKKVKFDCVDTWQGSNEHQLNEEYYDSKIGDKTLYENFLNNMKPVEGYFNPVRMTSLEAAKQYKDGSLDLVWIDANHEYNCVKEDILAWKPKIKKGGILGGDDYSTNWPGVIQAVDELIQNKNTTEGPYWYTIIES